MIKGRYFYVLLLLFVAVLIGPAFARAEELSPKEQKISGAYAQHLYTSMCSQVYRQKFPLYRLTADERQQVNKHANEACGCQYAGIAKVSDPVVVVDYLMYTYGMVSGDPAKRSTRPLNNTPLFKPIYSVLADKNLTKKCGFVR